MQRAMARQAEAERERRAKVISAEGEFQASERLKDAAGVMAQEPITVQLRYLQTLLEIGATNNSTIVFPIPIEFLETLGRGPKPERVIRADARRRRRPSSHSSSPCSPQAAVRGVRRASVGRHDVGGRRPQRHAGDRRGSDRARRG